MTKYSKIKKSSFAILALSLILVAVLAFGGTYAYFNASAGNAATIVTGTLKLTGGDTFTVAGNDSLVPNEKITVPVSGLTFEGNTVSALRIALVLDEANITLPADATVSKSDVISKLTITVAKAAAEGSIDWTKGSDGHYYYMNYVGLTGTTSVALSSILSEVSIQLDASAGNEYQGITIKYALAVQAAQAEHVGNGGAIESAAVDAVGTLEALTTWAALPTIA